MRRFILSCSFLVLLFGTVQAAVSIIPKPQKCVEKKGTFTVNKQTVICLPSDNEDIRNAMSFGMICFPPQPDFL